MVEKNFVNVFLLGGGFMLIFTSFQTLGNIEQTIIDSIKTDLPSFTGDGYTSLAIIYAALSLSNWVTPSVLSAIGPRLAMTIGAITYCLFMASFFLPSVVLLYGCSVVLGAGAALIWTGQGMYLSQCSNTDTISRNSGVFWAMLQLSMFFGNLLVFFTFQGKTHIDEQTRNIVFSVLIAVGIAGLVLLACLRHPATDRDAPVEVTPAVRPREAFLNAVRLFRTKRMLLLCITFVYTGLSLSFFSGVYGSSIGFTNAIGTSAKQFVGLNGVFIGVGEVLGGVAFGLLGTKTTGRCGRDPIVIVGGVLHLASYFLIYLNLPNAAPFGNTDAVSYIQPPSAVAAMACSFLLGLGDACFNTQCYSMLGGVFKNEPAEAFSIFKFTQSVAAAASFVYSSYCGLHVQLIILVVLGILGTVSFCLVEFASGAPRRLGSMLGKWWICFPNRPFADTMPPKYTGLSSIAVGKRAASAKDSTVNAAKSSAAKKKTVRTREGVRTCVRATCIFPIVNLKLLLALGRNATATALLGEQETDQSGKASNGYGS